MESLSAESVDEEAAAASDRHSWIDSMLTWMANRLLVSLDHVECHLKNWQPHFLIIEMFDDPPAAVGVMATNEEDKERRTRMLLLAKQLKGGRGLTVVAGVAVEGRDIVALEKELKKEIKSIQMNAHSKCIRLACGGVEPTVKAMMQCAGLGQLSTNTLLLSLPTDGIRESPATLDCFWAAVCWAEFYDMGIMIPIGDLMPSDDQELKGTIDVWWILIDGGITLLTAVLLKRHRVWRHCRLRVFAVAEDQDDLELLKNNINRWLDGVRIKAELTVVPFKRREITEYVAGRHQHKDKASCRAAQATKCTCSQVSDNAEECDDDQQQTNVVVEHADSCPLSKIKTFTDPQMIADICHAKGDPLAGATASSSAASVGSSVGSTFSSAAETPHLKAELLHRRILEKSENSPMVILNLPRPPKNRAKMYPYMSYLREITGGLQRVVLVGGTRNEVLTDML